MYSTMAEVLLYEWYKKANASSITLIKKMAKTVKDHWYGILSHFDSELSTGFLEGINSQRKIALIHPRPGCSATSNTPAGSPTPCRKPG